ncbi:MULTISPECIES: CheR family methyltransferase [unclassified Thioclava]|uniref:CheR family methyltransferase n=1 Tax=unclassified Thioclava TaxID=2621713 RepID=UPI000B544000|nr:MULTISPECIES: CheR family methyltransferase [unclassified Thioclava]OWY06425.1 chemotaxis protein CheR [Thioclava sp. IC9]OWY08034.1 chemotaxis protein CheR [Thioclava sp. F42-5]
MVDAATSTSHARLDRFRDLVHEVSGIRLRESKNVMIESRLRKRMVALGLPTLDAYLGHLFDDGAMREELPRIIDLITTNKTDFFREPAHYRFLEERIIPECLAPAPAGRTVRFRLWSAAASTGAEAWSAAMLLARAAQADRRLDWAILGTDISHRVLQIAQNAVFPLSDLEPVPPALRDAYLMQGRKGPVRQARIVPELRARVRFAPMNLMEIPYPIETGLDVVMLRNVLIYFDPPTQHRVLAALARHLRRGGYLIVGHSESMIVQVPSLVQMAPGVFRNEGAT